MSHTITPHEHPLVQVSPDGEIINPIMRGAVIDYKATAKQLAGWVASLRYSLEHESNANQEQATKLHQAKGSLASVSSHYTDLSVRHDKYVRASMRLRSHWLSFMFPRDILYPHEAEH